MPCARQDTTFRNDESGALRFLGWMSRSHGDVPLLLDAVFGAAELGAWAEEYLSFLQDRGCKSCTMANYLSALINTQSYVLATTEGAASGSAVEELVNLRQQCESAAREDRLFAKRHKHWISWEDVQKTRVAAMEAFAAVPSSTPMLQRAKACNELLVILLHSVTPPDREPLSQRHALRPPTRRAFLPTAPMWRAAHRRRCRAPSEAWHDAAEGRRWRVADRPHEDEAQDQQGV